MPADSAEQPSVASERPVFEIELWPGEGIPVIHSVRSELPLRQTPSVDAQIVDTLKTGIDAPIAYDSTRFQTVTAAVVRVLGEAVVPGRDLGAVRHLSLDQYYSRAFRDTTITLAPGVIMEYLQYRAEGTCFIRVGDRVVDANPCPVPDTTRFAMAGEPRTLWWIHVCGSASGWLLLTHSTARVVRRTF